MCEALDSNLQRGGCCGGGEQQELLVSLNVQIAGLPFESQSTERHTTQHVAGFSLGYLLPNAPMEQLFPTTSFNVLMPNQTII